jgi:site-specific DNA recombinase
MKRALIYTRVSSDKQVDGYSLDSQEDFCKKKAEFLDYKVVKVYREEGISGSTVNRAKLQEMLSFAKDKQNNISAIIVYAFSRLNRNALDYLSIRMSLSKCNVSLISVTEPSGDTPAEKMIGTILAGFNQYQNEERAQNVANSLKRRFFEGHITSKPPLGYLMQKVNGKSIAVKDPLWFPVLQNLWFRIRNEKLSLLQATNELNKLGIRSTHDSRCKKFLIQTTSKIFRNKFYMGILQSEKYGEAKGQQEPMIDENTYFQAREIITQKRQNNHERYCKQREDFPARGLIRCPICNRKLTAAWSSGGYKPYPYYLCYVRKAHKYVSIPASELHKQFYEQLDRITMTDEFMQWLGEMVIERYNSEIHTREHSEDQIYREIDELVALKKTIGMKNAKGIYSDKEYIAMKEDLDDQIMVKRGLISEHKLENLDIKTTVNFIRYYFTHMRESWERATLEGKLYIGCSMFPRGLVFEDGKFRTPELGRGYALTQEIHTLVSNQVSRQGFEPWTNCLKGNCSTN